MMRKGAKKKAKTQYDSTNRLSLLIQAKKLSKKPVQAGDDEAIITITRNDLLDKYPKMRIQAVFSLFILISGMAILTLMILYKYDDPGPITEVVSGFMGTVLGFWLS